MSPKSRVNGTRKNYTVNRLQAKTLSLHKRYVDLLAIIVSINREYHARQRKNYEGII